jgi:hypothetical protein
MKPSPFSATVIRGSPRFRVFSRRHTKRGFAIHSALHGIPGKALCKTASLRFRDHLGKRPTTKPPAAQRCLAVQSFL